ncbi:WxL protein host-binding domain-containing protein [Listeria valentina]|uniref:WxL protein host-binding domain-containing protein n=1 Tax=Listeria valentina TaxID=2705293 RepID=UPI001431B652|nr:DUF3324 domain-containing protein [Listeria valentina]
MKAEAEETNARNAILFTLQNLASAHLIRFEIEVEITREGKAKTLYKTSQKNMQVAPNSHFAYPISLSKL